MKHFTREVLDVDEADDKVQLTTFKAGQLKICSSLYDFNVSLQQHKQWSSCFDYYLNGFINLVRVGRHTRVKRCFRSILDAIFLLKRL